MIKGQGTAKVQWWCWLTIYHTNYSVKGERSKGESRTTQSNLHLLGIDTCLLYIYTLFIPHCKI
jgi:hypothetical protein